MGLTGFLDSYSQAIVCRSDCFDIANLFDEIALATVIAKLCPDKSASAEQMLHSYAMLEQCLKLADSSSEHGLQFESRK